MDKEDSMSLQQAQGGGGAAGAADAKAALAAFFESGASDPADAEEAPSAEAMAGGGGQAPAASDAGIPPPEPAPSGTRPQDAAAQAPPPAEANPELAAMRQVLIQQAMMLRAMNEQRQASAQPPEPEPEPEPEPLFASNDEFMAQFGDDPVAAIQKLVDKLAGEKVAAYQAQMAQKLAPALSLADDKARRDAVRAAFYKFSSNPECSDFGDYMPDIADALKRKGLPLDSPQSYETEYLRAKLAKAAANKPFEAYLDDQEAIGRLTTDERVTKPVIEAYLRSLQGGAKPATLGSGAQAPSEVAATPPNKPTNRAERKDFLKSILSR